MFVANFVKKKSPLSKVNTKDCNWYIIIMEILKHIIAEIQRRNGISAQNPGAHMTSNLF